MLIQIDFESDTPIYIQLKRQIIQGIALGELQPEESLPSVRQMAEDIGINLHTVNKAYNLLKADGFLTIDRRKGAIINSSALSLSENYKAELEEDLNYIIAEAYCRGLGKEEFLNLCSELYSKYIK
ncbi:MAG: GntR family transcriptional regulator [Bacillota bacterium]|nr:GntR family transcriptional regulator [Bacillota bacterium]